MIEPENTDRKTDESFEKAEHANFKIIIKILNILKGVFAKKGGIGLMR